MYLYWGHSVDTSIGKGSKRIRQQKMTEWNACSQKSDAPHCFFVSHKAMIMLQEQKEHIQEKACQCIWNK